MPELDMAGNVYFNALNKIQKEYEIIQIVDSLPWNDILLRVLETFRSKITESNNNDNERKMVFITMLDFIPRAATKTKSTYIQQTSFK